LNAAAAVAENDGTELFVSANQTKEADQFRLNLRCLRINVQGQV
jgi:hypothetical protein